MFMFSQHDSLCYNRRVHIPRNSHSSLLNKNSSKRHQSKECWGLCSKNTNLKCTFRAVLETLDQLHTFTQVQFVQDCCKFSGLCCWEILFSGLAQDLSESEAVCQMSLPFTWRWTGFFSLPPYTLILEKRHLFWEHRLGKGNRVLPAASVRSTGGAARDGWCAQWVMC